MEATEPCPSLMPRIRYSTYYLWSNPLISVDKKNQLDVTFWPPSCSHGTYQHKAITSRSPQLLIMGTWLPETCWATIRREIKNTKSDISWFFLSTLNYDARSTTHQIYIDKVSYVLHISEWHTPTFPFVFRRLYCNHGLTLDTNSSWPNGCFLSSGSRNTVSFLIHSFNRFTLSKHCDTRSPHV